MCVSGVCVSGTEQDKELSEGEYRTLDIYWLAVGLAHLRASGWFRKRLLKSAGCLLPFPTGAAAAAMWTRLPFVEREASSLVFLFFFSRYQRGLWSFCVFGGGSWDWLWILDAAPIELHLTSDDPWPDSLPLVSPVCACSHGRERRSYANVPHIIADPPPTTKLLLAALSVLSCMFIHLIITSFTLRWNKNHTKSVCVGRWLCNISSEHCLAGCAVIGVWLPMPTPPQEPYLGEGGAFSHYGGHSHTFNAERRLLAQQHRRIFQRHRCSWAGAYSCHEC